MELGADLQAVGAQLAEFHTRTGTSAELRIYMQDGVPTYRVWLASSEIGTFEFPSAQVVVDWLLLVNKDVEPVSAATRLVQAEQLKVQHIELTSRMAQIAKEIEDLPESQRILNATAEAVGRIDDANKKLAELEKQRIAAEEEAAAKEAELEKQKAEEQGGGKPVPVDIKTR